MKVLNSLYLDDKPKKDIEDDLNKAFKRKKLDFSLKIEIIQDKDKAFDLLKINRYNILFIDMKLAPEGDTEEGFEWFLENISVLIYCPVIIYSDYIDDVKDHPFFTFSEEKTAPIRFFRKDEDYEEIAFAIEEIVSSKIFSLIDDIHMSIREIEAKYLWKHLNMNVLSAKENSYNEYKDLLLLRIGVSLIAEKLWGDFINGQKMIMVPPLSSTIIDLHDTGKRKLPVFTGDIIMIKENSEIEFFVIVTANCDLFTGKINNVTLCKLKSLENKEAFRILKELKDKLNIEEIYNEDGSINFDKVTPSEFNLVYSFFEAFRNLSRIINHDVKRFFYIPPFNGHDFNVNHSVVDFNEIKIKKTKDLAKELKQGICDVKASLLPPFSECLITRFGDYYRIGTPAITEFSDLKSTLSFLFKNEDMNNSKS